MKDLIKSLKPKQERVEYPTSLRLYKADIPKIDKLAKAKKMTSHAFLVELIHIAVNSNSSTKTQSK